MRRLCLLAIACIIATLISHPALAGGYVMIDGGYGGEHDSGSFGVEVGAIKKASENHRWLIGGEFSMIFIDENPPDYLDYAIPHGDYRTLDKDYYDGEEFELCGKVGFEVIKKLFIIGGIGGSWNKKVTINQSNVTGWYYIDKEETDANVTGMGELRYISDNGFAIGAGYHSRRGVVVGVGFAF